MIRILIVSENTDFGSSLSESVVPHGFACSVTSYQEAMSQAAEKSPELLVIELTDSNSDSPAWEIISELKKEKSLPVIAMAPAKVLIDIDSQLDVDDFITAPYDAVELALRAKRLLNRGSRSESSELIRSGSLVIDPVSCEVAMDGKVIDLTFKEYEMLKLLAGSPGRVYTRQDLLNKVWGYDYFGGDRTVDVHIRRLRSKIEDAHHTFVETVRNIGYRFTKEA